MTFQLWNGYMTSQNLSQNPSHLSKEIEIHRNGPFNMPRKGAAYDIFQPFYEMNESKKDTPIMASPADVIKTLQDRILWVDTMVSTQKVRKGMIQRDHAKLMYVETIKHFVSGLVYGDAELSIPPILGEAPVSITTLNIDKQNKGNNWTYAGDTMTGELRLNNVYNLLKDVTSNSIKGDYIETVVWRGGGSSVFAKAVLAAMEIDQELDAHCRVLYMCDSFRGLPPGDKGLDKGDKGWDKSIYLEVLAEIVANNFIKYGLLDSNVVFARGFFNETMPPLSKVVKSLSVTRLDVSTCYNLLLRSGCTCTV